MVEKRAARENLENLTCILSDKNTSLPGCIIDRVFFFDILHHVADAKRNLLLEIWRILKDDGTLCVTDHHMTPTAIRAAVSGTSLFELKGEKNNILLFQKR